MLNFDKVELEKKMYSILDMAFDLGIGFLVGAGATLALTGSITQISVMTGFLSKASIPFIIADPTKIIIGGAFGAVAHRKMKCWQQNQLYTIYINESDKMNHRLDRIERSIETLLNR